MSASAERMIQDTVILPSKRVGLGDQMDRAIDRLRVVHLALSPEAQTWLDEGNLTAVWAVIETVIRDLEPVRNILQGCDENTGKVGNSRPEASAS